MSLPRVPGPVVLIGPTAVGKSRVALALAERFGGEIVNADALQAYRGLDVGTAKPSLEEQARVPHHLIDILDPDERYSAGEFARRARLAIADIESRGRVALVVGGSGLYVRALCEGISPVPPGDEAVRARLRERLQQEGLAVLRQELSAVDPASAARLEPGDTQRILRALEVHRVSGLPLTHWIERQPFGVHPLSALRIGLTLPRTILYDRIQCRVHAMLDRGWVREVEVLLSQGVEASCPAFQAIGYRQIVHYLVGASSREEIAEEIIAATRRFAKRQETWFRKEQRVTWFECSDSDATTDKVGAYIERYCAGGEPSD
jgi:tRNA dimethylallyltransferase